MNRHNGNGIPSGWAEAELGNLLPLSYGKGLTEEHRNIGGQVPVYGSGGVVGHHSNALTTGPTLIVGRKGAVGEVHYSKGPCWPIDTTYYCEAKSALNLRYFAHLLRFLALGQLDKSTAVPSLRRNDYNALRVPVAPETEQERIVDEIEKQFTRLDAAVGAIERVQANLKRYRASVLKDACEGRLVPTEAELARREGRSYEPASELLKRILADRRSRWESVANGKKTRYQEPTNPEEQSCSSIPEGWFVVSVEQVSWLVQYGSSAKTSEDSTGVIVLRMGNITSDGVMDLTNVKRLPYDHAEFPVLLLETGDLLFNRTNSAELVGKSAVYLGNPHPCSFASYLIRVKTLLGCDPRYLAACLNSTIGKTWIKTVVSQQVGQANVNGTKLQSFVFPLPPDGEQRRIMEELDKRLSAVDELKMQIEADLKRAERLRQAILKRAFEGKLVAQDPNDEPASVLLERIRVQRQNGHGREKSKK